ncbi:FecR family protein [Ancylomarina longa]|uniref:FecR family protein n=1 Tax=Ancylomarina longa TaxID=2487017 RepID=A0A434AG67_9BACT|nr:FecR family protein [Ancylomarina longa]RUT73373.1 FecR family protein [Ancylomarina longa]
MRNLNKQYRIGELIFKDKTGDLSIEEELELNVWLEENSNNQLLLDKLRQEENIDSGIKLLKRFRSKPALQKVNREIDSRKSRRILIGLLKYAAIIVLPIIAFWAVNDYLGDTNRKYATQIEPGSSKAMLMLSDGSSVELGVKKEQSIHLDSKVMAENRGNQLIYKTSYSAQDTAQFKVESFNTLVVPKQGEYNMSLSDGTRIWMNSSSSLRYPIQFLKNERKVYLTGEAYFEVARNPQKPFVVVLQDGLQVKVLGTKFNVMSYNNESNVETTLLEGKVEMTTSNKNGESEKNILLSNQQLSFNKAQKTSNIKKVDASIYAAWKDGVFIFKDEDLLSIMRKLDRWYGCMAMFENTDLQNLKFTGEIKKYDDFDSVIKILELTGDFSFSQKGNVVYVRKAVK